MSHSYIPTKSIYHTLFPNPPPPPKLPYADRRVEKKSDQVSALTMQHQGFLNTR